MKGLLWVGLLNGVVTASRLLIVGEYIGVNFSVYKS
jgi:hypothetical protein